MNEFEPSRRPEPADSEPSAWTPERDAEPDGSTAGAADATTGQRADSDPVEAESPGAEPEAAETAAPPPSRGGGILESVALVCVALALALTIKTYVAEAYEIKGRSMEPSFRGGEKVVVLKAFYDVERGDVIVFGSTEDPDKDLIKRVIGLPGDHVEIRSGRVWVNGQVLDESYIEYPAYPYETHPEEIVPGDCFYVLGDNRPDSHDSRDFHAIPASKLRGKVVLRWWPWEERQYFGD